MNEEQQTMESLSSSSSSILSIPQLFDQSLLLEDICVSLHSTFYGEGPW